MLSLLKNGVLLRAKSAAPVLVLVAAAVAIQAAPTFAESPGKPATQRASRLVGQEIRDRANHKLGRIEDLVVDFDSGRVLCVVAVPEHIYGDFHVLIPAGSFQSADESNVVLRSERTNLTTAPHLNRAKLESTNLSKIIAGSYTFFDEKPLWPGDSAPTNLATFKSLLRMNVRRGTQEDLGKVADLMIDLPSGRVVSALVTTEGPAPTLYALPPSSLTLTSQNSSMVVNADKTPSAGPAREGAVLQAQMLELAAAATSRPRGPVPVIPPAAQPASENLFSKIPDRSDSVRIVKPVNLTDTEITHDILVTMLRDKMDQLVYDNQVKINTKNGRVSLRGHVGDETQKHRLETAAEAVAGHGNVDSELEVGENARSRISP